MHSKNHNIFTWSIQWVTQHPDEAEQKGEITLDGAIKVFQVFPWDEQLAIIEDRTEAGVTSNSPAIAFANTNDENLTISASDTEGFYIFYQASDYFAEGYLSNAFGKNADGTTVEEVIERYFNSSLDSILAFQPNDSAAEPKPMIARYDIRSGSRNGLLWSFVFAGVMDVFLLITLIADSVNTGIRISVEHMAWMLLSPWVFCLPVAFLYLQYFLTDRNKKIEINTETRQLVITNNGKSVVVNRKDIQECVFVHSHNGRTFWSDFQYIRIKTSETTAFVITCLMASPYEIIDLMRVNYRYEKVFFPCVSYDVVTEKEMAKRRLEFEKQKQMFLIDFGGYETERLTEIINTPNKHADYAVAAAKEILQNRIHR
jgi:hypothetical protein